MNMRFLFLQPQERQERVKPTAGNIFSNPLPNSRRFYARQRNVSRKALEAGKNIILEIEIQGAFNIKKMFPDAVLMFLMPPTAAELENRLRGRGTEDEATIKARLARATQEAEGVEGYDYIVINDTVDACTQRIHEIVTSEKMKASHNLTLIEDIREDLKIYAKGE